MKDFELSDEKALEIGNFLKKRREELDYSTNNIMMKTNIDKAEISRIENGKKKKINPMYLNELAKALKLNPITVFKMVGFLDENIHERSNVTKIPLEKIIELPVYGQASAGNGYINMEKVIHYLPFVKGEFSKDSFLVKVHGDSMTPTITEGSLALVDPEQIEYIKGKVYVVTYNNETFIKRIEQNEELNIIILKSDNPLYNDIWISEEQQQFLTVEGRVIRIIKEEEF
ncbi:S24 family peptidase [Fusobacterium necrophorum]|uniref:S24 family peptidase n=1 Tax=Fusobacterium necrophorum TaxID=859 RepID=UPI00370DFD2D|nr:helix-turn-helix domain-containing protein [Fusobacterium necrophorum]